MQFEIKPTLKTPHVLLNNEDGLILIAGISIPEDPYTFYTPFNQELESYFNQSPTKTVFEFKLEYFNTSSTLVIRNILKFLAEKTNNSDILVKWYYEEYDEDMKVAGEEFDTLIKPLNISLLAVKEFK